MLLGEPKPRAGGATADEIPVANTPSFPDGTCGFDDWPGLYLRECTEPLVEGAADHRGLWQAVSGNVGRVLRVEQCGNRVTIVGGIAGEETKHSVHDMRMDGTVENGVNDINVQTCMPLVAVTQFEDGVTQALYPPGGTQPAVTRTLVDGRIVENRPSDGLVSEFVRICRLPIAPD